jgi:cbb3-type cytochrome oxidase subunit 1/cbb3-type cytochrome oxidase cytochrome c subunit
MTENAAQAPDNRVDTQLVHAHGIAAFVTLLIAVAFGIVVSLQFIFPDISGGWLPAGWGRLRYAHTQGIMLGWLGNAFFAFLYHAVPILTGFKVTSQRLGRWIFGIWNFAVMAPGWILVLSGISQPLEWAEFPLIVDAFVVLALGLAAIQFLPPFFKRSLERLYVSSWYIIGGLVFTFLSFPMGNIVPEFVPGAAGAAISGLWIHDAVGLFVTPLALAIIYFVIPAASGRPIYSHFLSMLGFWGLFFWYPLNGTHHYIFSVIPMEAQLGAIAASTLLGFVVLLVVTNLMLSLRGSRVFPKDVGLRFISMSVIFYLIVSVQGASHAQMALNQAIHFTDWVVGHSHLAMMGFATFAGIGGIIHAWQRIPWARYNARALNWAYWLLTIGISIMVIDLTIAGVIQAKLWLNGAPWLESVQASQPYWIIRSFAAIPVAGGFITLLVGLTTGPRGGGAAAVEEGLLQQPVAEIMPERVAVSAAIDEKDIRPPGRGLVMAYIVASVAGVGFFVLSVSLLGVWPGRVLAEQTAAMAPAYPLPPSASEERGRSIYGREGCAYCHSQQIRYTEADTARFGAPTLAWETRFDYPHMMGTRRIGPDLSRATGTRTDNWHFVHLFAPRTVVPQSVMPSYAALFEGSPDKPLQEARDLVAYLNSLGRARELAWPEGDAAGRAAAGDDKWALMSFDAPLLNAHPGRTRPRGNAPALAAPAPIEVGRKLWLDNCSGCHGDEGRGDGPAASWLSPAPANLSVREFTRSQLNDVLWNGVHNTSMPAWRDHSPENLAALVETVRSLATPAGDPEPSAEQLALGERVYVSNCAECHGDNGGGDGYAADSLPIAPTDFHGERPSLGENIRVIRNGVQGTSMAAWTDRVNDDEILAVAHYVRQFFVGERESQENSQ